jgi:AbrB family looped-hinge helix DNA binding protein
MGEWVKISENGRVLIPAEVRKQLGLVAGGRLALEVRDGAIVLETQALRVKRVQDAMRPYIVPGRSVVDELIAERRAENAREEAETAAWLAARHAKPEAAE